MTFAKIHMYDLKHVTKCTAFIFNWSTIAQNLSTLLRNVVTYYHSIISFLQWVILFGQWKNCDTL